MAVRGFLLTSCFLQIKTVWVFAAASVRQFRG